MHFSMGAVFHIVSMGYLWVIYGLSIARMKYNFFMMVL